MKYPSFFSSFFFKYNFLDVISKTTFHENPSSGIRVVSYGPTDRQTDMTKLIVAFSTFVKQTDRQTGMTKLIVAFSTFVKQTDRHDQVNSRF